MNTSNLSQVYKVKIGLLIQNVYYNYDNSEARSTSTDITQASVDRLAMRYNTILCI